MVTIPEEAGCGSGVPCGYAIVAAVLDTVCEGWNWNCMGKMGCMPGWPAIAIWDWGTTTGIYIAVLETGIWTTGCGTEVTAITVDTGVTARVWCADPFAERIDERVGTGTVSGNFSSPQHQYPAFASQAYHLPAWGTLPGMSSGSAIGEEVRRVGSVTTARP